MNVFIIISNQIEKSFGCILLQLSCNDYEIYFTKATK